MAVARDATGAGAVSTGAAISWTHTIGTKSISTYVLVGVEISVSSNSTATTCTATYGGVAMTLLSGALTLLGSSTNRSAVGIFYLNDPASGAQTVTVTPGGASTKARVAANSVSYNGCQYGQTLTQQSAASLTLSATSVLNGFDFAVSVNGVAISSPTQTQQYLNTVSVSGVGDSILIQDAAGTGSSISFSSSGTATTPETLAVVLTPAAKAATLIDPFDSSANWTLSSGNVTIASGLLTLQDVDAAAQTAVANTTYDLVSSSLSAEVKQASIASNGTMNNYPLQARLDFASANEIGFIIEPNAGTLYLYKTVAGVGDFASTVTWHPVNHRFLRLRESGGTTYWDTSPDSIAWTAQRSVANPFLLSGVNPWIQVYRGTGTSHTTLVIDNVNVSRTPPGNINRAPMIRSSLY